MSPQFSPPHHFARPSAPHSWNFPQPERNEHMIHLIVLLSGLLVGALAGVLVMAALITAGRASDLERASADAHRRQRKIAGPSGDSPSFLRGPGPGSPGAETSPLSLRVRRQT